MGKVVYISENGNAYMLKSRWIRVKEKVVTSRSWMYDYTDSCTEEDGKRIAYGIRHCGKYMCYEQFGRMAAPELIYDNEKNIVAYLSGYDTTAGLNPHPYYIEVSEDDAEYIRLWEYMGSVDPDYAYDTFAYIKRKGYRIANVAMMSNEAQKIMMEVQEDE